MVDFASALNTRAADIEKPKLLPRGTYIWKVSKVPTQSETPSGEWNIIEFPIQCVEATTDVDPDELDEFGKVDGVRNRISFMFPTDPEKKNDFDRSMYRLREFLTGTLGLEASDDTTLKELLDNSVNYQFMAVASWKPANDGETYVNVTNYAPV